MLRWLLVIFISLQAANAAAEAKDFAVGANPLWKESERDVASVASGLSFPRSPGSLQLTGTRDFVRESPGIDSTIQYKSADGAVIASVYLYLPGLAIPALPRLQRKKV